MNGFYKNSIYYGDTDSLYIERKYWDVLNKANLVGKNLCKGENDYDSGGIFYGLFLVPKTKYVLTIDEFGIIQQYLTFKRFNDSKRLLDRSQYFDMLEGERISAILPKAWEKWFNNGIAVPVKLRRCNDWRNKNLCTTCNFQVNENKKVKTNITLPKRESPNQFAITLPHFVE